MNKKLRQQVYQKYEGLCAYTGKPLEDDWQVDHIKSKFLHNYFYAGEEDYIQYKKKVDDINNLLPCLRIVNHYKRDKDLEMFREYMMTFHLRLTKLPKNPYAENSIRRKEYMYKVANAFDITTEKPFNGKFYFENNEKNI